MDRWDDGLLSEPQVEFVLRRLNDPVLIEDLSWGIVDTVVLRVRSGHDDVVVKAAGRDNHHIGREITARETCTQSLVSSGHVGALLAVDVGANALLVGYLNGELATDPAFELDREVHRQAGDLLRRLHGQERRVDPDYERIATAKTIALLDRPHGIDPVIAAEAHRALESYRAEPIELVPCHGDWHPRNWLVDNGTVRIIDFGRFDFRPAASDLLRLSTRQWATDATLESTFLECYGADPRDDRVWPIQVLREAVSTAVWAFEVGDIEFEAHGHRVLADAITRV